MPSPHGRRPRRDTGHGARRFLTAPLALATVVGVALPALAGDGPPIPPPPPDHGRAIHHEVPRDARVTPRGARATTPGLRVLRNGFASVQVNVDGAGRNIVGDAANEPSIAVDPTNPLSAAIGWRQFDTILSDFRQAGVGYTRNGGRTWTFPGVIEPGIFRSDPVLDADADGNFFYNSLSVDFNFLCTVFMSSDGGATWGEGVFAWGGDKQWMAIDRTEGIGRHNIYANWTRAFSRCDGSMTRSYDRGLSYRDCADVPFDPQWGTLAVGPDGEVYIAGFGFFVVKSSTLQDPDLPAEFELVTGIDLGGAAIGGDGPNPGGLVAQAWIGVDHSDGPTRGHVYMLSSVRPPDGDPLDVHIARSRDGGFTWDPPVRVNDVRDGWQWFGTMSVAPNGRIDAVWNDTRNDPGGYLSELYYSFSEDGGQTWAPGVAMSPPFDPHVGWPQQNKIGDYYDMVSDRVGAHLAYAATFNDEQDVYYLRINDYDCNDNGVGDATDIAEGTSADCNGNAIPDECDIAAGISVDGDGNGIPDECECFADLDKSGAVDVGDILRVLQAWDNAGGPEDLDESGVVDLADLLLVLESWGPCPVAVIGACCFDRGTCELVSDTLCTIGGGVFLGEGATCDGTCAFGSCCFTDGTCMEMSDIRCAVEGGFFQGEGTNCETACGDRCDGAISVGEGAYPFSTAQATQEGPELPPTCDEGGGLLFRRDVWFAYTASCDGTATVQVCDATFDTRLAVYDDGDCPGAFIACNDNACGEAGSRSSLSFTAEAGATYLVRIGARFVVGEGTLVIECAE